MDKGKRIETVNGEFPLPEAMISHIQSFMFEFQASRTTILSKSWYNAWLARPVLNIDISEFDYSISSRLSSNVFEEFVTKTMQRYQDLNMKIDSLKLRCHYHFDEESSKIAHKLIVSTMKFGTTNVDIDLISFTLPREVLGCETLVRLSINWCKVDGNFVRCSRLKSLTLNNVEFTGGDDVFKDIILCSILLEELSLSRCNGIALSRRNMYEHHKLRRLFLDCVDVDSMFFTDFASRFPCLKDLSILYCYGCSRIQIAGTSLETISLKMFKESWKCRANFNAPNIRKFTCYSGSGLPAISIKGGSREWELDISIDCNRLHNTSWFLNLKKLLTKLRLSKISLSVNLECRTRGRSEHEVDVEVVAEPLVVENLTIDAPPTYCAALLVSLFGILRPKFLTHYWHTGKRCYFWSDDIVVESIDILCKRLMHKVITPNSCGIPDQNMFGQFGLKKVNVEVYGKFGTEWRPLLTPDATEKKRKSRFQLVWD